MIERQTWVEHKFNLNIDPAWAYNILDRVADNPIRINHHFSKLSDDQLSFKPDNKWSIKEHLGHLIDLEELHSGRLSQFTKFSAELNAADMSNLKTEDANHNENQFNNLIDIFYKSRMNFINQFKELQDEVLIHEAIHPRLRVIMKPVDMLFFVGEHDDHHITSMLRILNTD